MTRPRVYISGPITQGDQRENVRRASEVFKELVALGFAPWCPHWSWYAVQYDDVQLSHEDWLKKVDFPWLRQAEVVLRMPGESLGADLECEFAAEKYIRVCYSIEELRKWCQL